MIKKALDKFSYSLAVEELKIRNVNKTDPISLSRNSLFYMQIIYFNEGCTISDISNLTGASKSAVTMKITKLEKDDLVYKVDNTNDKRSKKIYLSSSTIDAWNRINGLRETIFSKIIDKYSEDEIGKFCNIISDISDGILSFNEEKYNLKLGD